jgi:hypothetical protein
MPFKILCAAIVAVAVAMAYSESEHYKSMREFHIMRKNSFVADSALDYLLHRLYTM